MKTKTIIILTALSLLPLSVLARGGDSVQSGRSGNDTVTQSPTPEVHHSGTDSEVGTEAEAETHGGVKTTPLGSPSPKSPPDPAKVEAAHAKLCERVTKNLDGKSKATENHLQRMSQDYTAVEARWQRIIGKATAAGIDATDLQAALVKYKAAHAKLDTDFEALHQALLSAAGDCGDAQKLAPDKTNLLAAQKLVLQDRLALRQLRQTTQNTVLVPLLKKLTAAKSTPSATPTITPEPANGSGQ